MASEFQRPANAGSVGWHVRYPRVTDLATGEGAEVENTTTEGSLYRRIFQPGELVPGKVYQMRVPVIVNDNNSTDTCTLRVRFGTNTAPASNTACGASAAINVEDADAALVIAYLEVQSASRAVCYGMLSAPDAANVEKMCSFGPTVLTIATGGGPYYWDVSATWSVAHADNEVAAAGGHVIEA